MDWTGKFHEKKTCRGSKSCGWNSKTWAWREKAELKLCRQNKVNMYWNAKCAINDRLVYIESHCFLWEQRRHFLRSIRLAKWCPLWTRFTRVCTVSRPSLRLTWSKLHESAQGRQNQSRKTYARLEFSDVEFGVRGLQGEIRKCNKCCVVWTDQSYRML
jgi:hypothetical protein